MIVCKPKINTYFSIAVFEVFAGGLLAVIIYQLPDMGSWAWLGRLLVPVLVGIMLAIVIKVVWSLKTVRVAKEKFEIYYPIRKSRRSYSGKNLKGWNEQTIKTAGGIYKEVTLLFDDGKKISVSQQEHTDYAQLLKYMHQKFSKTKAA